MKTFLAQNQFISNPSVICPRTERSAAASSLVRADAGAAAVTIADPDGGYMGHRLSPALGTSVGSAAIDLCQEPMAAFHLNQIISGGGPPVPSGKEGAVSVITAPSDIDCINEIFFYARKLMTGRPRFMLDEAAFLAEIEEVPLFIRADGYLKRQA